VTVNDEQGKLAAARRLVPRLPGHVGHRRAAGHQRVRDGVRVNEPTVEEVNFDLLPWTTSSASR